MGRSTPSVERHRVSNLAEFEDLARLLNGKITKFPVPRDFDGKPFDPEFSAIRSEPSGGCGTSGCNCSAGLWVTGSEGPHGISVHFGDREAWTDFDYQHWRALVQASDAGEAC